MVKKKEVDTSRQTETGNMDACVYVCACIHVCMHVRIKCLSDPALGRVRAPTRPVGGLPVGSRPGFGKTLRSLVVRVGMVWVVSLVVLLLLGGDCSCSPERVQRQNTVLVSVLKCNPLL